MAAMASRVVQAKKNIKKSRRKYNSTNKYDGYAIFCDQDRVKISNLLKALKLLGLRVHCKDDAHPGDRFLPAVTEKGINTADCCLLFVSNNFTEDSLCMYLLEMVLLRYIETNRKYKIITIYLDDTEIHYLKLFHEIPIKKFSFGTKPGIELDRKLLCCIYKAVKGPQQKLFSHNPKKCHHLQYLSIKRKTKKILKERNNMKFAIVKYIHTLNGCKYVKLISLGYLICKCFINSFLWIKLMGLVTCPQIYLMVHHYLTKTIVDQFNLTMQDCCPSITTYETELLETKTSICRYCHSTIFTSKLNEHEDECCKPMNCESCGRFISQAHKQKHERKCIYEECLKCLEFHSHLHVCSNDDKNTTGIWEEREQNLQDDFSSLTTEVSLKTLIPSEVTNSVNKLMNVVQNSFHEKKKKKPDNEIKELKDIIQQLLNQLKNSKITDQHINNMISETMTKELVSVEFSTRSINYFRNFIYALELHCDIPLFKNQLLINQVMTKPQPQPKCRFFNRFWCKKSPHKEQADSKQVFLPLIKDLFKH